MLVSGLGPLGRDRPNFRGAVELGLEGSGDLGAAGQRQHQQLDRESHDRFQASMDSGRLFSRSAWHRGLRRRVPEGSEGRVVKHAFTRRQRQRSGQAERGIGFDPLLEHREAQNRMKQGADRRYAGGRHAGLGYQGPHEYLDVRAPDLRERS